MQQLRKSVHDKWDKITKLAAAIDELIVKQEAPYLVTIYACVLMAANRACLIRMPQSKFSEICLFFGRLPQNRLENKANQPLVKPHPRDVSNALAWISRTFPDNFDFLNIDIKKMRQIIRETLELLPHYDNLYDPESEEYNRAMRGVKEDL